MDTQQDQMWTPQDVSAFLKVPVATLYQWRRTGYGPQARRVGRHLRWHPEAIRAWLTSLEG